jgi:hypothetical protein
MKIGFVWGENQSAQYTKTNSVSVALWSEVLGCEPMRWNGTVPDLRGYQVLMVNLFHLSETRPIRDIKAGNPAIKVIVMPDPSLDLVLYHREWGHMFEEMALADLIGGRTPYDCEVYGALLNKPSAWLPSPIGPDEWFLPYREMAKEDYILALDHPLEPYASAHNVAALALIQRETGRRVLYADAREETKAYARLAGLEAEWTGRVAFGEFVEMTARARLCVDLYARHSYHRHGVLCAMVGTPCISSLWAGVTGHPECHPYRPEWALEIAARLLEHPEDYEEVRLRGFRVVEEEYSFRASRARIEALMERWI